MPIASTFDFTQFQAAVFDLDGTLIHSEHAWEASKIKVLAEYGIVPSQAFLDAYVGRGLDDFVDNAFENSLPLEERKDIGKQIGAVAEVLLPQMRKPIDGAAEFLRSLNEKGLKIAICSSSARRHINNALAMLEVTDCVEVIISGQELPRGKPDPLPYLEASSALKVRPENACAFEDSVPGARSAFDAGTIVFAIGNGCTVPEFEFCHHKVKSYSDFKSAF